MSIYTASERIKSPRSDIRRMSTRVAPRWRWLAAFLAGIVLYVLAKVIASVVAQILLGGQEANQGAALALVGALRVPLAGGAIALALRIARARLSDLGLPNEGWRRDALIGLSLGAAWALLELFVVVPMTGGAARSDVVESRALMGSGRWGMLGLIVAGWLAGGVAEELYFRGHIVLALRQAFGPNVWSTVLAVLFSACWFGLAHRSQGTAGLVSSGLEGLMWALLYVWRGRLTGPMVGHGVFNTLAVIGIFYLY